MDREEILARSRQENKNRDMEDLEVQSWATGIAVKIGVMLCGLLSVLEAIFRERPNMACWTIFFGVLGATMVLKFYRLRRKHELVVGLLYFGFCAFFFVMYVRELIGG